MIKIHYVRKEAGLMELGCLDEPCRGCNHIFGEQEMMYLIKQEEDGIVIGMRPYCQKCGDEFTIGDLMSLPSSID